MSIAIGNGYYGAADVVRIRAEALENAKMEGGDNLWSFIHSTLFHICEHQGGKHTIGGDGFFKMRHGEFDINTSAEYLQIALETRAEFQRERAENDKSG